MESIRMTTPSQANLILTLQSAGVPVSEYFNTELLKDSSNPYTRDAINTWLMQDLIRQCEIAMAIAAGRQDALNAARFAEFIKEHQKHPHAEEPAQQNALDNVLDPRLLELLDLRRGFAEQLSAIARLLQSLLPQQLNMMRATHALHVENSGKIAEVALGALPHDVSSDVKAAVLPELTKRLVDTMHTLRPDPAKKAKIKKIEQEISAKHPDQHYSITRVQARNHKDVQYYQFANNQLFQAVLDIFQNHDSLRTLRLQHGVQALTAGLQLKLAPMFKQLHKDLMALDTHRFLNRVSPSKLGVLLDSQRAAWEQFNSINSQVSNFNSRRPLPYNPDYYKQAQPGAVAHVTNEQLEQAQNSIVRAFRGK